MCLVIRSDMPSRTASHITSGPRRIDTSLVCSIMRGVFLSYGFKTLCCTRPASKSSTMSFYSCHTLFTHAWQDLISCSSLRLYPHSDWHSFVSTIKKETRVRQPVRNQPLTPQLPPTISCKNSNISSSTLLNTWMIPLLRETSPSPTVSSSSAAVDLKRALQPLTSHGYVHLKPLPRQPFVTRFFHRAHNILLHCCNQFLVGRHTAICVSSNLTPLQGASSETSHPHCSCHRTRLFEESDSTRLTNHAPLPCEQFVTMTLFSQ